MVQLVSDREAKQVFKIIESILSLSVFNRRNFQCIYITYKQVCKEYYVCEHA